MLDKCLNELIIFSLNRSINVTFHGVPHSIDSHLPKAIIVDLKKKDNCHYISTDSDDYGSVPIFMIEDEIREGNKVSTLG